MDPIARREARLSFALSGIVAAQLRASPWGRAARVGTALLGAWSVFVIVALRVADGPSTNLGSAVVDTMAKAVWLGATMSAFAAAGPRELYDRASGLESLQGVCGVSPALLRRARSLGAARLGASTTAWPVLLAGLAAMAAVGTTSQLARRGVVVATSLVFALTSGALLGAAGAFAGQISPLRGRTLLVSVVLGTVVVSELVGDPRLAIPSAMGHWLHVVLRAMHVGIDA